MKLSFMFSKISRILGYTRVTHTIFAQAALPKVKKAAISMATLMP